MLTNVFRAAQTKKQADIELHDSICVKNGNEWYLHNRNS